MRIFNLEIVNEKPTFMKKTTDYKSFHYLESGEISFSMVDTIKTVKELDPGVYRISWLDHPKYVVQVLMDKDAETPKVHSFADREKIDQLFESFFNPTIRERISAMGFYHKVGILFYGKEGTGKSTIIKHYYNQCITNNKALVFYITERGHKIKDCWDFIYNIRNVQDNPIIVIFEEIESCLKGEPANSAFLKTALDGNLSIDNSICLATTNHIDLIPEALKDRPSRFKYVLNIEGIQSKSEVYDIIKKMLGRTFSDDELKSFAMEMVGQPLDCIKQFCLDKIMDLKHYTKSKKGSIGFLASTN